MLYYIRIIYIIIICTYIRILFRVFAVSIFIRTENPICLGCKKYTYWTPCVL